jgi:acyl carrier protein phosphodiesterase
MLKKTVTNAPLQVLSVRLWTQNIIQNMKSYLCEMNFLAHAFLSFTDPEILTGNLISDFVKGKKKFLYQTGIQRGITLHRLIDEFTDKHAATARAKVFFRDPYGLYSGAFIDIVYDHFLANDPAQFPDGEKLKSFSVHAYQQLEEFIPVCPPPFQLIFRYMKKQNWLYNYRFKEGIHNSFAGLVRRARYMDDHEPAMRIFEKEYAELRKCYESFFPDIWRFAWNEFNHLSGS